MAKYISAEIAKKALADSALIPRYAENCKPITDRIIDSIPSADVEPVRHGRWITTHDEFCSCSLCKYPVHTAWSRTYYCPNCGAKMEGGGEDG